MAGPEKTFKNSKGIEITAWRNDKGNISFKFRKSYKVKDSDPAEYKDTNYLFAHELGDVADLCKEARTWFDSQNGNGHEDAEATPTTPTKQTFESEEIPF